MSKQVNDCTAKVGWVPEKDPQDLDPHTPGAKMDANKEDYSLIPLLPLKWLAKVFTYGARKYTRDGWFSVPDAKMRYQAAMWRHWVAAHNEVLDPESGLPHVAHFLWNAWIVSFFALTEIEEDTNG